MRAGDDEDVVSGVCRTREIDPVDAALDRELDAALLVDPSPSLAARVRAEVANQEPSPAWELGWSLTAGAVALAAILALTFTATRRAADGPPANAPIVLDSTNGRPDGERAITDPRPAHRYPRPATNNQRRTANHQPPAAAVQFSQAEARGLQRLIRLARAQDPALAHLFAEQAGAQTGIAELFIPPVVIERLEPAPALAPDSF